MARKSASSRKPLALRSLQQVKALAHPLRFRMFERLIDEPRTGKQLAELLGTKPTQLYHHLRVLQRSGLIKQAGTRKKRGTTEKYFQAVSDRITINDKLFKGRANAGSAIRAQVLQVAAAEIAEAEHRAAEASPKPQVLLKRLRIRTSPERIEGLVEAINEWLACCEDASQPDGPNEYAVVVALYPTQISSPAEET